MPSGITDFVAYGAEREVTRDNPGLKSRATKSIIRKRIFINQDHRFLKLNLAVHVTNFPGLGDESKRANHLKNRANERRPDLPRYLGDFMDVKSEGKRLL